MPAPCHGDFIFDLPISPLPKAYAAVCVQYAGFTHWFSDQKVQLPVHCRAHSCHCQCAPLGASPAYSRAISAPSWKPSGPSHLEHARPPMHTLFRGGCAAETVASAPALGAGVASRVGARTA